MNLTQKLFSIRDSKTESFNLPFYQPTTAAALRIFEKMHYEENSMLNDYPDDFALFELGEFDTTTAKFTIYAQPISLGLANQFVNDAPQAAREPGELKEIN